jgi:hypothetical protein
MRSWPRPADSGSSSGQSRRATCSTAGRGGSRTSEVPHRNEPGRCGERCQPGRIRGGREPGAGQARHTPDLVPHPHPSGGAPEAEASARIPGLARGSRAPRSPGRDAPLRALHVRFPGADEDRPREVQGASVSPCESSCLTRRSAARTSPERRLRNSQPSTRSRPRRSDASWARRTFSPACGRVGPTAAATPIRARRKAAPTVSGYGGSARRRAC